MTRSPYEPTGFALQIFQDRYAIHKEETFKQACERVARVIADAEMGTKRDEYFIRFLDILQTNRFSPGGRIWRGAGRPRGQLLNCFCIPAEDSREGWGDVLRNVTIISGTGGGVGINFSKIRPRGTKIRGTGGEATGSVSL
jgi:ribonucleoside-diphosphate reductase alpha chain